MSSEAWVIAKLSEILEVEPATITVTSRLDEDVECDSIDLIELINAAEDEFDIVVDEDALYDVRTVGELAALVDAQRASSE